MGGLDFVCVCAYTCWCGGVGTLLLLDERV